MDQRSNLLTAGLDNSSMDVQRRGSWFKGKLSSFTWGKKKSDAGNGSPPPMSGKEVRRMSAVDAQQDMTRMMADSILGRSGGGNSPPPTSVKSKRRVSCEETQQQMTRSMADSILGR